MLNAFIQKAVIWPLIWLGAVFYLKSGKQARWIFEKIRTPRSLYLTARNMLHFHLGIPRIAGWISMTIEPAAVCNLTCEYCARGKDKNWTGARPTFMDWALFTKIIDEAPRSIETVCLAGIGEPLMHPRIIDMIEYASNNGRRVYMFSNGTLLEGELLERLAASPLDVLNVSIEPDVESARRYRGVDYDEVAENVRAFAARKGPGQTLNLALVMNEMHEDRICRFEEEWRAIVDHVKISPQMGLGAVDSDISKQACSELWRGNMDIKTNGNISVCCFDSLEDLTVGNAATDNLNEVINHTALHTLLQRVATGDLPERCRRCTSACFTRKDIARMTQKAANRRQQ